VLHTLIRFRIDEVGTAHQVSAMERVPMKICYCKNSFSKQMYGFVFKNKMFRYRYKKRIPYAKMRPALLSAEEHKDRNKQLRKKIRFDKRREEIENKNAKSVAFPILKYKEHRQ
jgi:hypothetical protein